MHVYKVTIEKNVYIYIYSNPQQKKLYSEGCMIFKYGK